MNNPYEAPAAPIRSDELRRTWWSLLSVPIGLLLLVLGMGFVAGIYLAVNERIDWIEYAVTSAYGIFGFGAGALLLLRSRRATFALGLFALLTMALMALRAKNVEPAFATIWISLTIGFWVVSRLMRRQGALR